MLYIYSHLLTCTNRNSAITLYCCLYLFTSVLKAKYYKAFPHTLHRSVKNCIPVFPLQFSTSNERLWYSLEKLSLRTICHLWTSVYVIKSYTIHSCTCNHPCGPSKKSIPCTGLNTITLLTFLSWKTFANTIQFSSSF